MWGTDTNITLLMLSRHTDTCLCPRVKHHWGQTKWQTVLTETAPVASLPRQVASEGLLWDLSFHCIHQRKTCVEISAPVSALSGASVIDSSCYRSGQVVSYHTGMQSDTSSAIDVSNGTVLATGLVPPAKRFITLGHYYHGNLTPLRCQVTTNGELIVYYSTGTIPSQYNPIVFEINYIAK